MEMPKITVNIDYYELVKAKEEAVQLVNALDEAINKVRELKNMVEPDDE